MLLAFSKTNRLIALRGAGKARRLGCPKTQRSSSICQSHTTSVGRSIVELAASVILISGGVSAGIADAAEQPTSGYVIVPPRSLPETLYQEAENLIDLVRRREVFGEEKLLETVEQGKGAIETAQIWANKIKIKLEAVERALAEEERLAEEEERNLVRQEIVAKENGGLFEVKKLDNKIKEDEAIVKEDKKEILRLEEALDRVEIIGNKIETQEAPDLIDQPSDSDAKAPSRAEVIPIGSGGPPGMTDVTTDISSGNDIVPQRSFTETLFQEAENLIDQIRKQEIFGEAKLSETLEKGKSAIEIAQSWAEQGKSAIETAQSWANQIRIKVGAVERALEEQEKLVEKEEKDLVDQEINAKESGALDEVEKIENKIKEDEAIVQEEKEEIIRLEEALDELEKIENKIKTQEAPDLID